MSDVAMPIAGRRRKGTNGIDVGGLRAALEASVDGDVRFDAQAKAVYSTDASNYREVPIGVVIPRSADDVVAAVATCRRFGAPLTNRGGGTGLAGQTCNEAVIIDFSKYLNRILEIDAERRFAWVEPGCVLDDLRREAGKFGLTFGPDPSTHNHCTLGGMVGNNSCGVHSVMAGRTADNIEALEVLTYEGERFVVGATSEDDLARLSAGSDGQARIYRALASLRQRNAGYIKRGMPQIPRRVSGYNLDALLAENGCNVAQALVGSEGTCVTVLRIKCRLVPDPPARVLLAIGFSDVGVAGDAVPRVLEAGPIGLEGVDEELVRYMRLKHVHEEDLEMLPDGHGWLFAEFGADTTQAAEERARGLMCALDNDAAGTPSMRLIVDREQQERIWRVREAGLPATAHVPDMGETHPGWEDAAVPPEKVGSYLRDFRRLLDEFSYNCSLYGHFGDGCIHCRIDFDFSTEAGVEKYLQFISRAADLVVSCGGSLSGEHGDGQSRGALLEKMYGGELMRAFAEFKRIWDPEWMMNPGKVVAADGPAQHLKEGPGDDPASPRTRLAFAEDKGDFAAVASRCVGVGACRKHDAGTMCPSYRATGEEAYSTRGRARLLFEMLRGEVIEDGWRSEAVRDGLDFCLACKACKSECPVSVDMASYKAEFMYHHFKGRLRPRAGYSMGLIWWWSRLASRMPRAANAFAGWGPLASLAKRMGGIAQERSFPRFAAPSFHDWWRRRRLPAQTAAIGRPRVLLWPDTFNAYFTSAPLIATVELLEHLGWQVEIPSRPLCCGRPLYAFGFLGLADRLWSRVIATLGPYVDAGIPIVGLEPTCVTSFRDELPQMRPHDVAAGRLARSVQHLSEFLQRSECPLPAMQGRTLVQPHCHHRAVLGVEAERTVLERAGLDVNVLDAGCCGMAGDFGFDERTYDVAMRIGERAWLPQVREAGDAWLVADGFSCREQAFQATGRMPLTLPEVLMAGCRQGEKNS